MDMSSFLDVQCPDLNVYLAYCKNLCTVSNVKIDNLKIIDLYESYLNKRIQFITVNVNH